MRKGALCGKHELFQASRMASVRNVMCERIETRVRGSSSEKETTEGGCDIWRVLGCARFCGM